jgi:hypothetical protein
VLTDSEFKCESISPNEIREYNRNWKKFYRKYGGIYFNYSIPIFNSSHDFAYFKFTVNTYGVGKSYFGIYEKKNGKWYPIDVYAGIIRTNNWR